MCRGVVQGMALVLDSQVSTRALRFSTEQHRICSSFNAEFIEWSIFLGHMLNPHTGQYWLFLVPEAVLQGSLWYRWEREQRNG